MLYWTDGTELYHYGISGQKWGNRRFQNQDGSLTEEGRRRYGVGQALSSSLGYMRKSQNIADNARLERRTNRKLKRNEAIQQRLSDKGKSTDRVNQRISDIKKSNEYRKKALDIEKKMSTGKYLVNNLLATNSTSIGSKSYASLVASGMNEKTAQKVNLLLGSYISQNIADYKAKQKYGIKKLRV